MYCSSCCFQGFLLQTLSSIFGIFTKSVGFFMCKRQELKYTVDSYSGIAALYMLCGLCNRINDDLTHFGGLREPYTAESRMI